MIWFMMHLRILKNLTIPSSENYLNQSLSQISKVLSFERCQTCASPVSTNICTPVSKQAFEITVGLKLRTIAVVISLISGK